MSAVKMVLKSLDRFNATYEIQSWVKAAIFYSSHCLYLTGEAGWELTCDVGKASSKDFNEARHRLAARLRLAADALDGDPHGSVPYEIEARRAGENEA